MCRWCSVAFDATAALDVAEQSRATRRATLLELATAHNDADALAALMRVKSGTGVHVADDDNNDDDDVNEKVATASRKIKQSPTELDSENVKKVAR
jgi:hypothetical protein